MSKKTSSERRRHRAPVSLLFDFTYLFLVLIEVFVVLKSLEFLILLFNLQIKSRGTFGNNTSQRQGTFKLQQFVDSRSSIRQVNNWIHLLFCVELTAVAYAYVAEFLSFFVFCLQGVLAQRRSNFHGNQFPVTKEAGTNALNRPTHNRAVNWSKPR